MVLVVLAAVCVAAFFGWRYRTAGATNMPTCAELNTDCFMLKTGCETRCNRVECDLCMTAIGLRLSQCCSWCQTSLGAIENKCCPPKENLTTPQTHVNLV